MCTPTHTHTHTHIDTRTHTCIHTQQLKGSVGLLFTNKDKVKVQSWFEQFEDEIHPRSGFTATEEVVCGEGPLTQFTHSMEPQLRKLGLPTALKKGEGGGYFLTVLGY